MRLPRFEYHAPERIEQVFDLMESLGSAAELMAGGTDLLPGLKLGKRSCDHIVSLSRLSELKELSFNEAKGLRIGAGTVLADVAAHGPVRDRYRMLASAIADLATVQVRHRATVAGNLCNASPCADTAPPLMAMGAIIEISSSGGRRDIPLEELMVGPGSIALEKGEIVTAIIVPTPRLESRSTYIKFSPRSKVDIAAVNVAVSTTTTRGRVDEVEIFLGTVAPTPIRARRAEVLLKGSHLSESLLASAAAAARDECLPITDFRATEEYKRHLVEVLTKRALMTTTGIA
ncbi:MAG: molybdopterin dehydrogenase [Gemmatimonadetes bacterium]|nr:molybdopterin dehydrogenase [Gemmatimonadota bacterium]